MLRACYSTDLPLSLSCFYQLLVNGGSHLGIFVHFANLSFPPPCTEVRLSETSSARSTKIKSKAQTYARGQRRRKEGAQRSASTAPPVPAAGGGAGPQPAPSSRTRAPPGNAVSARLGPRLPPRGGAQPRTTAPGVRAALPAVLRGGLARCPRSAWRRPRTARWRPSACSWTPSSRATSCPWSRWPATGWSWTRVRSGGGDLGRFRGSARFLVAAGSGAVLPREEPSGGTELRCIGLPAEPGSVRACSRSSGRACAVGPRQRPGRLGACCLERILRIRCIRMKLMPHTIPCIKALCLPLLVVQTWMLRLFMALLSLAAQCQHVRC